MFNLTQRYKDLFQKLGYKTILLNGILWKEYQKMVVPVGPVNKNYFISVREQEDLLRYFKGSILVRTTTGFIDYPNQWYCIILDKYINLEKMTSKEGRRKVEQGLKNCLVRRIDKNIMEKEAWGVLSAAFKQYRNTRLTITEEQFRQNIINDEFEDIHHYWGVFEKKTGKLIAYAQRYLYEKTEVNFVEGRFHPDFLHLYPSYALYYETNRYYLNEQKFAYVNEGFRCLLHNTNIQDFLIKKLHFKKQPIGLKIHYRPFIGKCMLLTYPCRSLLGKLYQPLAALYKLEEINRA
jgi:hypothetical protein